MAPTLQQSAKAGSANLQINRHSRLPRTTMMETGSLAGSREAEHALLHSPYSLSESGTVPSSQSQDDACVPSPLADEVHQLASHSQYSLVPSSQSQENCDFTFPAMRHSSPERRYSQYEIIPSSQSQERDFIWPNGATSNSARTSTDELVPTSQCDEIELHIPDASRADDHLWLIGMNRISEGKSATSPEAQLVESPKALKSLRRCSQGGASPTTDTGLLIEQNDSASAVKAVFESQPSPQYVTQFCEPCTAHNRTTVQTKEDSAPAA